MTFSVLQMPGSYSLAPIPMTSLIEGPLNTENLLHSFGSNPETGAQHFPEWLERDCNDFVRSTPFCDFNDPAVPYRLANVILGHAIGDYAQKERDDPSPLRNFEKQGDAFPFYNQSDWESAVHQRGLPGFSAVTFENKNGGNLTISRPDPNMIHVSTEQGGATIQAIQTTHLTKAGIQRTIYDFQYTNIPQDLSGVLDIPETTDPVNVLLRLAALIYTQATIEPALLQGLLIKTKQGWVELELHGNEFRIPEGYEVDLQNEPNDQILIKSKATQEDNPKQPIAQISCRWPSHFVFTRIRLTSQKPQGPMPLSQDLLAFWNKSIPQGERMDADMHARFAKILADAKKP